MTSGLDATPLAHDLVDRKRLDPLLSERLMTSAAHENTWSVPDRDLDAILGRNLERTIDWLRGLCDDPRETIATSASACLRDLVEHIIENIRMKQLAALSAKGGRVGFQYSAENYLWLVNCLSFFPSWSVVTLNFDSLVDRAFEELWQLGLRCRQYDDWRRVLDAVGQDHPVGPARDGVYVKLHGSVDVYSCVNANCTYYRRPFTTRKDRPDMASVESFGSAVHACPGCGDRAPAWVVPPGKNKSGKELDFIGAFRARAIDALSRASAWVVVGYSFPQYDDDVAGLLKEAIQSEPEDSPIQRTVYVVGPAATEVAERVQTLTGYPSFANTGTFSDLVDAVLEVAQVKRPMLTWADGEEKVVKPPSGTPRSGVVLEYGKDSRTSSSDLLE